MLLVKLPAKMRELNRARHFIRLWKLVRLHAAEF